MSESQAWRRGFAAGFVALALGVGGQVATRASDVRAGRSCSLTRSRLAQRLEAPRTEETGLAQRVALAVLGAMLNGCS